MSCLESISVVAPSARGRAKGRQTRSADESDITETEADQGGRSKVEEARRSLRATKAGARRALQPAEARMDYWNRLLCSAECNRASLWLVRALSPFAVTRLWRMTLLRFSPLPQTAIS